MEYEECRLEKLLILTYILIGRFRNESNGFASIVTSLLYLIFAWTFLYSWFDQNIGTLIASVVGMALAFLSIYAGFSLRIKALRLYGLILTILMTVKAITLDLSGSDGVTRVIALLIGGLICFGISVVYTKLEKTLKHSGETGEVKVE